MVGPVPKPPKGHFNILYFAGAGSFTSKEFEALPAPLPLSRLFDVLEERYGGIRAKVLASCLVTVNLDYVDIPGGPDDDDDDEASGQQEKGVIEEGDEVAIIPPVSSG